MSTTSDPIPRSDLTTDQKRRVGTVQAAKAILQGNVYNPPPLTGDRVDDLLRIARFMYGGG